MWTRARWSGWLLCLGLGLGAAARAGAQVELVAPSLLTLRAPALTAGTRLDMAPDAPGAVGRVAASIGQSSPPGRLTGFTSLTLLRTGFWPIAALVDCNDPADRDCDGLTDDVDLCPYFNSQDQTDSDGNGIGNVCECSDQSGDGLVTVSDVVEINQAVFSPALIGPLCDGNHDRQCTVVDIVHANARIFGGQSSCRRNPLPAP
jgi:hypothetical protein